jgi:hypothetical protein
MSRGTSAAIHATAAADDERSVGKTVVSPRLTSPGSLTGVEAGPQEATGYLCDTSRERDSPDASEDGSRNLPSREIGPTCGYSAISAARSSGSRGCSSSVTAAAMIDRLVHHVEILALKGDSYRLRDKDLKPAAVAD